MRFVLIGILCCASGPALPQTPTNQQPPKASAALTTLTVTEEGGGFRLAVPISRLAMKLPRGAFVWERISASPRYFFFTDHHGTNLSGWFESSEAYVGLDKFWRGEAGAFHEHGLPGPQHVAKSRLNGWELITYDFPIQQGTDANIRAEWVQDGTWIDVHVSSVGAQSIEALRARVMDTLKSIQIIEVP